MKDFNAKINKQEVTFFPRTDYEENLKKNLDVKMKKIKLLIREIFSIRAFRL